MRPLRLRLRLISLSLPGLITCGRFTMESSLQERIRRVSAAGDLRTVDVCVGRVSQRDLLQIGGDEGEASADRPSRVLIASITKPIVAMAVARLAAEGEFSLTERIGTFLPAFRRAMYRRITIRHLLTHTSGFPDMLPDNEALRASHASLAEFLDKASHVELDFATARDCRYSSIGFLILGAIMESVTKTPTAEFLREHFFHPLGMKESWLGLPVDQVDRLVPTVAPSILPSWQPNAETWGWNSRYWRTLGAPWGGMISTAADLGLFAEMMLSDGCARGGQQIIPTQVLTACMSDQLRATAAQPDYRGPSRAWGLGWRHQWPDHFASFGDFVSNRTIGHWGATGTMMWIDPEAGTYAVILTTTPYETSQPTLQRISNLVATSSLNEPARTGDSDA